MRTINAVAILAVFALINSAALAQDADVLSQKANCHFVDMPLAEAVKALSEKYDVAIRLDKKVLRDVGIPVDESVNLIREDVTLESLLAALLDPLGLTTVSVPDEGFEITTKAVADRRMSVRTYDLRLIPGLQNVERRRFATSLREVLGGRWVEINGNGGTLKVDGNKILVNQTDKVHAEIERLLAEMTRIVNPQQAPPLTKQEQREREIHKALQQPRDIKLVEVPFEEMVHSIGTMLNVPVLVDVVSLHRAGISTETPVIAVGTAMPASEILDAALQPLKMTWFVEDEVVKVTTLHFAEDRMVTRVYDIRPRLAGPESEQRIIERVEELPGLHWETIDGLGGTLQVLNGMLLVRQHYSGQKQIAALLSAK